MAGIQKWAVSFGVNDEKWIIGMDSVMGNTSGIILGNSIGVVCRGLIIYHDNDDYVRDYIVD